METKLPQMSTTSGATTYSYRPQGSYHYHHPHNQNQNQNSNHGNHSSSAYVQAYRLSQGNTHASGGEHGQKYNNQRNHHQVNQNLDGNYNASYLSSSSSSSPSVSSGYTFSQLYQASQAQQQQQQQQQQRQQQLQLQQQQRQRQRQQYQQRQQPQSSVIRPRVLVSQYSSAMVDTPFHQGGYRSSYSSGAVGGYSKQPIYSSSTPSSYRSKQYTTYSSQSNLKEHDPLDKKALDSWRLYQSEMLLPETMLE